MMKRVLTAPCSFVSRTWVRLVGFGVVLAAVFALGLVPLRLVPQSSADTVGDKKKLDAGIARLRTELEGTSRDLAGAFVALQRTRALLPGARKALNAAAATQRSADRHNEEVATALAVAEANAAKAADALAKNARESQEAQDQLVNMVRDDYQRGEVSGLSIALEADSPEDFTDRMIMMDTVMRVRLATIRGLDTMRAQGNAVRAHLVAVHQQVRALKVQAEAALARARAARQSAAAAKTRLDLLYAARTRYAATVAAKKAAEVANLKKMQAQSNALARVLAARAKAAREAAARAGRQPRGGQPRGDGFLSFPSGAYVSSEFGMRLHPILQFRRLHEGIDFAADCGSPVYAAAAGEVIMTTLSAGGYGGQVVIDHGFRGGVDLTTTYNHLSSVVVTGGLVRRGQLVAYAGNTGLSTGCHLHFETREDGIPVNPRLWL